MRRDGAEGEGGELCVRRVRAGDEHDGAACAEDESCGARMRKVGEGFSKAIAGLVVGHDQQIRITRAYGGILLVFAGFAADGEV